MTDIWTALAPSSNTSAPPSRGRPSPSPTPTGPSSPPLVALLEALAADPAPAKADGYVLHLYAMLLLAAWRDTRAYRPLAELGHLDEASIDEVFGQLVHDSYGRALASCCDGDIAPLTRLADDDAPACGPAPQPSKPSPSPPSPGAPPAARWSISWPTSAPAKPCC
jgi:hypothetical protein